jgi:hypothetical protein
MGHSLLRKDRTFPQRRLKIDSYPPGDARHEGGGTIRSRDSCLILLERTIHELCGRDGG